MFVSISKWLPSYAVSGCAARQPLWTLYLTGRVEPGWPDDPAKSRHHVIRPKHQVTLGICVLKTHRKTKARLTEHRSNSVVYTVLTYVPVSSTAFLTTNVTAIAILVWTEVSLRANRQTPSLALSLVDDYDTNSAHSHKKRAIPQEHMSTKRQRDCDWSQFIKTNVLFLELDDGALRLLLTAQLEVLAALQRQLNETNGRTDSDRTAA